MNGAAEAWRRKSGNNEDFERGEEKQRDAQLKKASPWRDNVSAGLTAASASLCAGNRSHEAGSAHPALIEIFFSAFFDSARFGSVIVRTPFLKVASILSSSTLSGSRKERWNEP